MCVCVCMCVYLWLCVYVCVYVCMCVYVNYLKRCKTSNLCFFASRHLVLSFYPCRGMERTYERTYEAPSNEAPHMILGYHQGRLVTYLQNNFSVSFVNGNWLSLEPACPSFGFFLVPTLSIWQQHWLWRWQLLDTFVGSLH